MGSDWWMASDRKWYPPELHPDVFNRAPTEELPAAPAELPPPPPAHLVQQRLGGPVPPPLPQPGQPATQQLPIQPGQMQPPAGPGQPSSSSKTTAILITLAVLVVLLAGGLVAALFALRTSSASTEGEAIAVETTAVPTTLEAAPTTVPRETSTVPDSTAPTTTETTTTIVPVPSDPDADDRNPRMPDVLCVGLVEARVRVSAAGAGSVRTYDATGGGRMQIVHENWIVVEQDPSPGSPVAGREVNLGVVKKGETTDC